MNTATRAVDITGASLLAVALLLPVGDAPWFSFWREWTAAGAALLIVLGAVGTLRDLGLSLRIGVWSLPAVAAGLAILCWVQFAIGLVPRHADALMASLYLVGFALCTVVAASLPAQHRDALADRLAIALLVAALLSAPLAVLQWLGLATLDLGVHVSGGRPVAHMEQANLLCSLSIQGALGAWRLIERRRIGWKVGAGLLAVPLLVVVLTQSRVAWLVGLALLGVTAWRRDALPGPVRRRTLAAVVAAVVITSLLLPWLDAQFGLAGAKLSERTSEGRRPAVWSLFLDAVLVRPWAGWGALQDGAAQFALADRHPSLAWYFSSAHDLVIDLMVWFGAPVGLLAGTALLVAVGLRLMRAPDMATLATALAAAALVLHGLVELPLQYSYFLLPLGLMVGITSGASRASAAATLDFPARARGLLPALALAPALLLALLASEYIRVTDSRPVLGTDMAAHHLVLVAQPPLPDVVLLDQLKAFHAFAAEPLRPGLPAPEIDAARAAMLRLPYVPSIERYALLAGLNGREPQASDALRRLCKFEPPTHCEDSQRVWAIWRERWPQLPRWPLEGQVP